MLLALCLTLDPRARYQHAVYLFLNAPCFSFLQQKLWLFFSFFEKFILAKYNGNSLWAIGLLVNFNPDHAL
jgi:hypothetical protein